MPIEIKEMHIKINVNEDRSDVPMSADKANGEMIQECLDQMSKMMNDKEER